MPKPYHQERIDRDAAVVDDEILAHLNASRIKINGDNGPVAAKPESRAADLKTVRFGEGSPGLFSQ